MRPNIKAFIRNHTLSHQSFSLETNELGYRNRPIGLKDRPRVLFLGDSITLSDYLPEAESFPRQVESLNDQSFEVINAAVGATGIRSYRDILLETGLSTSPDAIVVGLYLNDYGESPSYSPLRPPGVLKRSWFLSALLEAFSLFRVSFFSRPDPHHIATRELLEREIIQNIGNTTDENFLGSVVNNLSDWGGAWTQRAWDEMGPIMNELKHISDERLIKLYFVLLPVREQVENPMASTFPQQKAQLILRNLNVPVLDLLESLRTEYSLRTSPLYYDHCHFTAYGNGIVAKEVSFFLRQHE